VQALTTQINLARIAPAQLVAFIEKQAGECMTPSRSEEIGARKGLHRVHLWWKIKAFYWGHGEPFASLNRLLLFTRLRSSPISSPCAGVATGLLKTPKTRHKQQAKFTQG